MRSQLVCILVVATLFGQAGCDGQSPVKDSSGAVPPAKSHQDLTETDKINQWFEARFREQLAFSPLEKTLLGIKDEDYFRVDDASEAAGDRFLQWRLDSTEEMTSLFDYGALSDDAKVSYDTWAYLSEQAAAAKPFKRHAYIFTQMDSLHSFLPQLMITSHRVETAADMDAYISRISESARAIEQLIDRSRVASELGIRPPRFAFELVIKEAEKIISGQPFDDSTVNSDIWDDARAKIAKLVEQGEIDKARAEALTATVKTRLLEQWKPAYEALIAWQEEDITYAVDIGVGVGSLPNGSDFYAERLANQTTTDLTAEEIHAIGLAQVARLHAEMELVVEQIGFDGELRDFFALLRDAQDERFFYPNTDEGRLAYIDAATAAIENIKTQLPDYFGLLPKADLIVKRVESFREQDGAAAHYFPSTPDGSRPGTYYAHLSDMRAVSKTKLEVMAYHEAVPGHHMQIAIAQELEDVPRFRRHSSFNAFAEGWGLYAESLAGEMPGTYEDPYSEFGRLTSELWRAVRLVVDTGIHAKGWNEQRALDYALANSPEPETKVLSEVWRYIVLPGQATGYMIGMLKIRELKRKAESELDDGFDIRGFHDMVLGSGALPLGILERQVDRWIARQKAP